MIDQLSRIAETLGPDEQLVLLEVAQRLKLGRPVYGVLSLADDPRDMIKEAHEEMLDGAIYLAMATLRRRG